MSKQLVAADNIDSFICKASGKVFLDGSIILTPGAKDALAQRGIGIESGPKLQGCISDCNSCKILCPDEKLDLLVNIAAVLIKEHGISDPAELKAASIKIMQTLEKHL